MKVVKVNGSKKRVLIVDDHPLLRVGVVKVISQQPDLEVSGEADDVGTALEQVAKSKPDLALVDLSLKAGSGLDLIKQLKARYPSIKSLVFSARDESIFAERALRAGALGYVHKQADAPTLIRAFRVVMQGKLYLSPTMTHHFLQRVVGAADADHVVSIADLTDRELEVYRQIGRGLSNRQIAVNLHLSTKTIDSYRETIKIKLKLSSARVVARHAMQWVMENSS